MITASAMMAFYAHTSITASATMGFEVGPPVDDGSVALSSAEWIAMYPG